MFIMKIEIENVAITKIAINTLSILKVKKKLIVIY